MKSEPIATHDGCGVYTPAMPSVIRAIGCKAHAALVRSDGMTKPIAGFSDAPYVSAAGEIVWIGGLRRGAAAPLTERTRRVLQLALVPLAAG